MPNFDSGVSKYIYGACVIRVGFPVDHQGNVDISCKQCKYYSPTYRSCKLNDEMIAYPNTNVGHYCPLELEVDNGESEQDTAGIESTKESN